MKALLKGEMAMHLRKRRPRRGAAVGMALLAAMVAAVQLVGVRPAQAFSLPVDLGAFGDDWSSATAVNDSEEIVGQSGFRPVIWLNRQIQALPLPAGASYGTAVSINSSGYVVGWVLDSGWHQRAVVWNGTASVSYLDNTYATSSATMINDAGEITGWVQATNDYSRPVMFTGGSVRLLPPFNTPGGVMAMSNKSAGANVTAGWQSLNCPTRCVQYGVETGISGPGAGGYLWLSPPSGGTSSQARAVSADGTRIAGIFGAADATQHLVLWTLGANARGYPAWAAQDLGLPAGMSTAYANGANPWATVVAGNAYGSQGAIAFYWQSGVGFQTLAQLGSGCGDASANGINGVDEIVGEGCTADGRTHAMLWT
jgi:uncharacterized membrane protein